MNAGAPLAELETGDMIVFTVAVPSEEARDLSVSVLGRTVTLTGPAGYEHDVEFPLEADLERLQAQLYRGIVELRAPREVAPVSRPVPLQVI